MERFLLTIVFQILYPAFWTLVLAVYFNGVRDLFRWARLRRINLIYHLDWIDVLGVILYGLILRVVIWALDFGVMGAEPFIFFNATDYVMATAPVFLLMHLFIWANSDFAKQMRQDAMKNFSNKDKS